MMVFLLASYLVILAPVRLAQVYSIQPVLEAVARPRVRRLNLTYCPNGLGRSLGAGGGAAVTGRSGCGTERK
jgi:hypothetical protein